MATLLGVPIAGINQYGYIATAFSASPLLGDIHSYITPAFSRSP